MNFLDNLRKSWSDGNFILLYDSDDREGEVDMVIPSIMVKERHVALMRNDAGGLICTALSDELCENVGLPYMTDIYEELKDENLLKMLGHGLPYGARSSFSIAINHKDSFTGITDVDRAMTINELGNIAEIFKDNKNVQDLFTSKFRIPGHVPLLRGRIGLLKNRKGHTELGLALCEMTDFGPSVTMCEMMDSDSGQALSVSDAKKYAEKNNIPFVSGEEIIKFWNDFINNKEV